MARKTKNNHAAFALFAAIIVIATVVALYTRGTGQAVATQADLKTDAIWYDHLAQPRRLIQVRVCNIGNTASLASYTKLVVNNQNRANKYTPPIAARSCTTVKFDRCTETGIANSGGNYKANARVDNNAAMTEPNEANNVLGTDVSISAPATGSYC